MPKKTSEGTPLSRTERRVALKAAAELERHSVIKWLIAQGFTVAAEAIAAEKHLAYE